MVRKNQRQKHPLPEDKTLHSTKSENAIDARNDESKENSKDSGENESATENTACDYKLRFMCAVSKY